jgi:hypothetical protein
MITLNNRSISFFSSGESASMSISVSSLNNILKNRSPSYNIIIKIKSTDNKDAIMYHNFKWKLKHLCQRPMN